MVQLLKEKGCKQLEQRGAVSNIKLDLQRVHPTRKTPKEKGGRTLPN